MNKIIKIVDENGRVYIPSEIRDRLKFNKGNLVEILEKENSIEVIPVQLNEETPRQLNIEVTVKVTD